MDSVAIVSLVNGLFYFAMLHSYMLTISKNHNPTQLVITSIFVFHELEVPKAIPPSKVSKS